MSHHGSLTSVNRVVVEAPASIANLGPGFDVLAMAIEGFKDVVEVSVKPGGGNIVITVEGIKVPSGRENVAYGVIEEAIRAYNLHNLDFYVKVVKGVPPGLGLGSSGATAAATAYALSLALGLNLSSRELLKLAGAGEALVAGTPHYDNVAASLFGGIVLVDPARINVLRIEPKKDFWIAIISPSTQRSSRKTYEARKILPNSIELSIVVRQLASIGKLVHALHVGDLGLLGEAISSDFIAEPYRSKLIEYYWELKKMALRGGALGFNIAGAGPSVFSIHDSMEKARNTGKILVNYLKSLGIEAKLYVTRILRHGVRVIG